MFFGKYLDRMHDGLILSGATHHVPSAATVGSLVAYVETCAWVVSVESWANTRRGWTVLLSRETVSLGLFGFIFKSRLFLFPWLRSSFSPSTEQSMKHPILGISIMFAVRLRGRIFIPLVCCVQMRAADAKAAKTSTNLGTKFQQTQQMWSRPTRSMTQVNKTFSIPLI